MRSDVTIKWITPSLGTASYYDVQALPRSGDEVLIDIRALVDREGNADDALRQKVQTALAAARENKRIVICCDMGISRSNALAVAVLMATGRSYSESLDLVSQKSAVSEINLALLRQVRSLYGPAEYTTDGAGRRLMITGATGFIGSRLIDELADEYRIFAPRRDALDLSDTVALDAYVTSNKIDVLMHLAHPRNRNNISAMASAVAMMKNILEVCRLNGTRLFWLSGLTIYSGYRRFEVVYTYPDMTPLPCGTYGETKLVCEELARLYAKNYGTQAVVLRPAGVYGAGMPRSTIVAKFFEMAMMGATIQTHEYENGLPAFDFLHVRDLASAVRQALHRWPAGPIHLGTGKVTSTYDLARLISELAGGGSQVERIALSGTTSKIGVDPEEAAARLGWRPTIDLRDGLMELRDYYRARASAV